MGLFARFELCFLAAAAARCLQFVVGVGFPPFLRNTTQPDEKTERNGGNSNGKANRHIWMTIKKDARAHKYEFTTAPGRNEIAD